MCAVTECAPAPAGCPVPVATEYNTGGKEVADMADGQPYVRMRRYTDQGGRRPSRPVDHPSTVLEVDVPRSSL